jgi:hypothetical protein
MRVGIAIGSLGVLGILGLIGCAGASGSASVSGTDPVSARNAPAGVSVMTFLDLEQIRPDMILQGAAASLPPCVQAAAGSGVTTYTFNNCTAANEGAQAGTITVTGPVAGSGGVQTYTEVYQLTSTTTLANHATQTWTYTGQQLLTFTGTSARLSLANPNAPIQAAFSDSAVPANNMSYAFTPSLSADLDDPTRMALSGGYSLVGSNGNTITCDIGTGNPLVWVPAACESPASGSLTLALASPGGNDQTTASFGPGCGNLNISGATVALGGQ